MVYNFNEEAYLKVINAAKATQEVNKPKTSKGSVTAAALDSGRMSYLSECISVSINNDQVCLNIPIYGQVCITLPIGLPSGTLAQACLNVCTHFGIPTGVTVSIAVAGQTIVTKTFGYC